LCPSDDSVPTDATPTLPQLTQLDVPEKGVSIRIMDKIGSHYHTLGIFLLNDEDGGEIKTIEYDCRRTADILREIFHRWICGHQMRNGKKINTWEKLVEYLGTVELTVLAKEIDDVLQFCSEIIMRMDNSEECALEYHDYKYKCEVPLHRCGECKCIAPIEAIFRLQLFVLVLGVVIIVAVVIVASTIYHCKGKGKLDTCSNTYNMIVYH
jgi:hypothetical protein